MYVVGDSMHNVPGLSAKGHVPGNPSISLGFNSRKNSEPSGIVRRCP
jgi:hypothetical protein